MPRYIISDRRRRSQECDALTMAPDYFALTAKMDDDIFYFTETTRANPSLRDYAEKQPILSSGDRLRAFVKQAVTLAAEEGNPNPPEFNGLSDLVRPELFRLLIEQAHRRLCTDEAAEMQEAPLAVARIWTPLSANELVVLEPTADNAPLQKGRSPSAAEPGVMQINQTTSSTVISER